MSFPFIKSALVERAVLITLGQAHLTKFLARLRPFMARNLLTGVRNLKLKPTLNVFPPINGHAPMLED